MTKVMQFSSARSLKIELPQKTWVDLEMNAKAYKESLEWVIEQVLIHGAARVRCRDCEYRKKYVNE